jgi:hypothetical protein
MRGLPPRLLDSARRRVKARQAVVAAALLAAARLADANRPLPLDLCLFKHVTGRPCPTCGLTRAFCHAAQGHWAQSVVYHPLGPPLALAVAGWMAWSAAEAWRGRPALDRLRGRVGTVVLAGAFVLTLAAWIARLVSGQAAV